ncbi:MAG: NlpC/P60 family protein [Acidobacteriota bacterium]
MKPAACVLLALCCAAAVLAQAPPTLAPATEAEAFRGKVREVIDRHLGKPYGWGCTGIKRFDCSGFVWRVMADSGVLIKRTTARKLFMCLPEVPEEERWRFGNLVFFDDLQHCGIVSGRGAFYHSSQTEGTHLSTLGPFWQPKLCGFRAMPAAAEAAAQNASVLAIPTPASPSP